MANKSSVVFQPSFLHVDFNLRFVSQTLLNVKVMLPSFFFFFSKLV